MDARYQPSDFEARIFDAWLAAGVFAGDPESPKPSFVIALPPPNITGELHMGHALNGATQDTLIRLRQDAGARDVVDLRHRPRVDRASTP